MNARSPSADMPTTSTGEPEFGSPAWTASRNALMAEQTRGFEGHDAMSPKTPSGHAYGIRISTRLTSEFRKYYRKDAMDITTQDVVDVLTAAGIKKWVLMGLHGYVGYLPEPRATQDVDVMVPYSQRAKATKALSARWPQLVLRELSQVTRFCDPGDLNAEGQPKAVLDLMLPWSPFQELILKEHVKIDEKTSHRLPTLEAALVSKYAAFISPMRDRDKKEQDAVDFRRIARANHAKINHEKLQALAKLVYDDASSDIERFVRIAISDDPMPI